MQDKNYQPDNTMLKKIFYIVYITLHKIFSSSQKPQMTRSFIILSIFLLRTFLPLAGQVTIFPEVDHQDRTDQTEVMRVEVTDDLTIVDFIYHPPSLSTETGAWACVDRSTYITPTGREERKYLIMAKKVSICPKMIKIVSDPDQLYTFQLYFPPLQKNTLKIDIIGKNMNIQGVNLTNPADYPPVDSAPYRNQEAFLHYFYAHRDQLDPIEGLWRLQVRRQHFLGSGTYLEEEALPPQVVAIIKEGDVFVTYNDSGLNRREYFKKLSGKKGYFFRTVFPEVEGESSAYTFFSDPDRFYLKYQIPDRLAHYYLMGSYIPGTKMMEIAEYYRVPLIEKDTGKPVFDLGKDTIRIKKPPTNHKPPTTNY